MRKVRFNDWNTIPQVFLKKDILNISDPYFSSKVICIIANYKVCFENFYL